MDSDGLWRRILRDELRIFHPVSPLVVIEALQISEEVVKGHTFPLNDNTKESLELNLPIFKLQTLQTLQ